MEIVRIPSESAGSEGIVVCVTSPEKARYGSQAPVAISIPGGLASAGLDLKSAPMASEGFVECTFNFPGGGSGELESGGTYDSRGPNCQKALRDVIRFALGESKALDGRTLADLVKPIVPQGNNVGLVGYSHGGNAALAVAGVYGQEISSLAWIVNWESPVGDGCVTADAGGWRRKVNPAYNTETGEFDLSLLAFDPDLPLESIPPTRPGAPASKGALYFDIDQDGRYNEEADFALKPRLWDDKMFYATRVARYAAQHNLIPPSFSDRIATPEETDEHWRMRTGQYWFDETVKQIPDLRFIVVASEVDHVQVAPDHPHVLIQYEGMRKAGARFVRLNAARAYVQKVWGRLAPQAVDNVPLAPFDHQSIRTAVQPVGESGIPRDITILSAACELADRTHRGSGVL